MRKVERPLSVQHKVSEAGDVQQDGFKGGQVQWQFSERQRGSTYITNDAGADLPTVANGQKVQL
jgi:hypothetical protein